MAGFGFAHRDLATIMGSWPMRATGLAGPISGDTRLVPRALISQAAITSIRREPTAGFAVGGLTFYVWVDGTRKTITFPGGGPYSLAQVIAEVNSDAGLTIAYDNNRFLELRSPTVGEGSSLRLETVLTPDVFHELGLFAETTSQAGDVAPAQNIDPTRQVALPNQLSVQHGESFDASTFNRLAFGLAASTDRMYGLMARKRIAVKKETTFTYTDPGAPKGFQITDSVFTGLTAAPSSDALESIIAILDDADHEIVNRVHLNRQQLGGAATSARYWLDNAGEYHAEDLAAPNGWQPITDADCTEPISVEVVLAAPVINYPAKILRRVSATECIVQMVDPLTGVKAPFTPNTYYTGTGKKVRIEELPVRAARITDGQGGGRVELQQVPVYPVGGDAITITKIEKNNRVYVDGALFKTRGVVVGDLLTISGSIEDDPYSNDGTYRVAQVVDEETVDLAGQDFEPVYLNAMGTPANLGDVSVTTDGHFWTDPWIQFTQDTDGNYTTPTAGTTVKVVYLTMTNMLDAAAADPSFMSGPDIRYNQEVPSDVQKAILNIVGSSAVKWTDVLYPNDYLANITLERLDYRLNKEHYYTTGRHSVVEADRILLFDKDGAGSSGETLRLRNSVADETYVSGLPVHKTALYTAVGEGRFYVNANGGVEIKNTISGSNGIYPSGAYQGMLDLQVKVSSSGAPLTGSPALSAWAFGPAQVHGVDVRLGYSPSNVFGMYSPSRSGDHLGRILSMGVGAYSDIQVGSYIDFVSFENATGTFVSSEMRFYSSDTDLGWFRTLTLNPTGMEFRGQNESNKWVIEYGAYNKFDLGHQTGAGSIYPALTIYPSAALSPTGIGNQLRHNPVGVLGATAGYTANQVYADLSGVTGGGASAAFYTNYFYSKVASAVTAAYTGFMTDVRYASSGNLRTIYGNYFRLLGETALSTVSAGNTVNVVIDTQANWLSSTNVRGCEIGVSSANSTIGNSVGLFISGVSGNATVSNQGIGVNSVSGAAANNYGMILNSIAGASSSNNGLHIDSVTGAASNNRGIVVNSVTNANVNNYGVSINTVSGAGSNNYGVSINTVSGAGSNNYGLFINTISGAASSGNYGIVIGSVSGATLNFSIYSSAAAPAYFAGSMGINVVPSDVVSGLCMKTNVSTSHLTLKSTGLAHGLTTFAETDTYYKLGRVGSTGAVWERSYGSSAPSYLLECYGAARAAVMGMQFNVQTPTQARVMTDLCYSFDFTSSGGLHNVAFMRTNGELTIFGPLYTGRGATGTGHIYLGAANSGGGAGETLYLGNFTVPSASQRIVVDTVTPDIAVYNTDTYRWQFKNDGMFQLWVKTTAGDPATATPGTIYFNSSADRFRGRRNGNWQDL